MKKLFIALTSLVSALTVSAQADLFDNPGNHPFLGIRVGLDVSSAASSKLDCYNNGVGFNIGAVYNIPVYKNLYVEPGLSLFYNTFGTETVNGLSGKTIDGSIRNFGFRVPIVAGFNFDFTDDIRVAPFTGPQLNMSVIARDHYDDGSIDGHSIFGEYGFKHFDLQWVFGVGVTYQNYYLSVSGGVGMTKVLDVTADSFRRNTFNLSVGYNF